MNITVRNVSQWPLLLMNLNYLQPWFASVEMIASRSYFSSNSVVWLGTGFNLRQTSVIFMVVYKHIT